MHSWLEALACPGCGGGLEPGRAFEQEELQCCACRMHFPIANGIPSLVLPHRREAV
ncbi:MAG: Trm112 family protein, partial [Calditrichaeota bacterium]